MSRTDALTENNNLCAMRAAKIGGKLWAGIFARLLLGFVMVVSVAGCSWTDNYGTHHLIIGVGFGVITATNSPGVDVYDTRILGASVEPDGAGVGWMQHNRVEINPNLASNVVISVKSISGGVEIKNYPVNLYNSKTNNQIK
jgi:hypothetical protein